MTADAPEWMTLLVRYLRQRDVTIGQAAIKAGVNPNTAPAWVNLKNPPKYPPLIGIAKLAAWLEIPPQELFDAVLEVERAPGQLTLVERVTRLERIVADRSSDQEVLALERELDELLGDDPLADEVRRSRG